MAAVPSSESKSSRGEAPSPTRAPLKHDESSESLLVPERAGQSDADSLAAGEPSGPPTLFNFSIWDTKEAVRAAARRELGADLLKSSVERIGKMAGFTALLLTAYLFGLWLLHREQTEVREVVNTATVSLGVAVAISVALFLAARSERFRPQSVTDLGCAYLLLLSLLLGLVRHSQISSPGELARHVAPAVIPILAFGALIPAAQAKSLAVLLGAAAMDPLAMFMMHTQASYSASELVLLLASPICAAIVAHSIARVVHRLNARVVKAREVGSYRLVERLGEGGMAEVWRANHRMLARPAAVKLIRPKVLIRNGPREAERLLRLFTREVQTTAALSSPHTIQVYDFGVTRDGAFYYVMELLDGIDLQTLVERYGPQSSERVAYLLIQACHSLREAHERNFVHRDVKPANIFVCSLGGEHDFVKVLDFGLVLDRHPTAEELEDERHFIGTPAVMAPEMVRFQSPVDARADIYALGCVAYWLLTGVRVFEATKLHDMLVMHAHQKPAPPSRRIGRPMHEALEAVVMACLDKNPNRRPQTARELQDILESLEFEEPWNERRAAEWWHAQSLVRPRPRLVQLDPLEVEAEARAAD
ncbi:MAG: serine/threonine protein kinase [Myxococcota bacterium]|nr:serine/threonine protein kinase [Myxococcota bacterium]